MAAAGADAERTLREAMAANKGEYLLAIDGSIPVKDGGVYSLTGGRSNVSMLAEIAADAKAVLAIGTCAAYGGIPKAYPNPTGAVGVEDLVSGKPIVNIPGCPPVPEVLSGVLVHFISFGRLPDLDDRKRPLAYFGTTIHDQCYRRPFYDQGKFAKSFDDEGARQGWCLFELGCKGPVTHNACASLKWNGGTSFPIESGPWLHRLFGTRFLGRGQLLHLAGRRQQRRDGATPASPLASACAGGRRRSAEPVGAKSNMTLLDFARGPGLQAAWLDHGRGHGVAHRRHSAAAPARYIWLRRGSALPGGCAAVWR